MKSLMSLYSCVLQDCGTWCGTSTTRDINTVTRRFEHEGVSFLTITLPNFCAEFETALDAGFIADDQFAGFSRSGGLPRFLSGFLQLVFDRSTGILLSTPDPIAIWAVRQVTRAFGKIQLECAPKRIAAALDGYVECEKEVARWSATSSPSLDDEVKHVSRVLYGDLLSQWDLQVYSDELVPRHGPGKTADRLRGNAKWKQCEWPERLEEYFPALEHLLPNHRYWSELEGVRFLEPDRERPVKVVCVPKTLKAPRIIAIEPTCMQYAQQALMAMFVDGLEKSRLLSPLIGFTDQGPNQFRAELGSRDGSLATLDLSEASDRVSLKLVRSVFSLSPHLLGALEACRSQRASVPGRGTISLSKFASMGSATCFPVEAMVHLAVVFVGIQRVHGYRLTEGDVRHLRLVRVYGDDIIVPTEYVHSVIEALEDFGLRVNSRKSFWNGKFRESCGKEYYEGNDVSIVKVRRVLPSSRRDAQEIVSTVSLRNQMYQAGLWGTARWLDKHLRRIIPLPMVLLTSPVLGRQSCLGYESQRTSATLHRPEVKGAVLRGPAPPSNLDGWQALRKCLSRTGDLPFQDHKHLERSGRPDNVHIKVGWYSAT